MTKVRLLAAALSLVALAGVANATTAAAPKYPTTHKVVVKPMQTASMHHKKMKKHKKHAMHSMLKKAPAKAKAV